MIRVESLAGRVVLALLVVAASLAGAAPPDRKPAPSRSGGEKSKPLNPRGRMDDHPTDKPARYYLWEDAEGWHLRSCSRHVNKFEGQVRIEEGTFRKLRPIGIDPKGRGADQWAVNKERTELKFVLNTAQSFDGFDFTVEGAGAELEFELLINAKPMPARIFVGREGEHPPQATFSVPAVPEQIEDAETPASPRSENRAAPAPKANTRPKRST